MTTADKIGSCTGVTDWRLLEVQSNSEALIFWNITSYRSVWVSLMRSPITPENKERGKNKAAENCYY